MRQTVALLLNNSSLKVAACLMAYFYWSLLSDLYAIEAHFTAPVIITTQKMFIDRAPTHAMISVRGMRKYVRALDPSILFVNIHESELTPGINLLTLKPKHVSLPSCLNLVDYSPVNFVISAHTIDTVDAS